MATPKFFSGSATHSPTISVISQGTHRCVLPMEVEERVGLDRGSLPGYRIGDKKPWT